MKQFLLFTVVFLFISCKKNNEKIAPILTVIFGLAGPLPLFLYQREKF